MNKNIRISVRNLIEFVLRSGDIDNSFKSNTRAVEGTLAHQKVQKTYGENYRAEVSLKHIFDYGEYSFEIEGRADGVYHLGDEALIDEIKSTIRDLNLIEIDYNPLHWAQAKVYGLIYCLQNSLKEIDLQVTYFHIETEEVKRFKEEFTLERLEEFFSDIMKKYIDWAELSFGWEDIRDSSIESSSFPFSEYRNGQRELAVSVYKSIKERKNLFAKAPTGIGKTMSTIFPAIKAMKEGAVKRIFYLTAKTITREAPLKSMELLIKNGLKAKAIVITAKDKVCLNDEVKCNPRDCEFAKGHFDRVNEAIMDIFSKEDLIDREKVKEYALKHRVCPFEFSLDISLWMDIIICDYNYVFDPQVYLKRFFEDINYNYVFLIDEAHNLIDRSREMFSASLNYEKFKALKDVFRGSYPSVHKKINKINGLFNSLIKEHNIVNNFKSKEEFTEFYFPLKSLLTNLEPWLIEEKDNEDYEQVIEVYFDIVKYLKISELFDENYVMEVNIGEEGVILKLFCVNPSSLLKEAMKRGSASIFFSATLTPIDYYKNLLGGREKDYHMRLASPFPRKNLKLLIRDNISTRYRDRENSYGEIVEMIKNFVEQRRGNYFVFFPSYIYMRKVYEKIEYDGLNISMQEDNMSEGMREEFLERFAKEKDLVAFGVLGGMFSEGIDLVGDKLIGAIIVSVGLPGISFERDTIRDYFNETSRSGFDYAYTYPGINKVLQAAGRVIRTEGDRGAILLIDDRFGTNKYKRLFPEEWSGSESVKNNTELKEKLKEFWKL
nr:ATP-dependent DNA helicase [Tissierella sp.]